MKITSRKEAINQGMRTYYTGMPCKNGHLSLRATSSSACRECQKAYNKKNLIKINEIKRKKDREKRQQQ